jgi:hypothetical protein
MELSVSACALGMRPGCCDNVRALGATSVFRVLQRWARQHREKGRTSSKEDMTVYQEYQVKTFASGCPAKLPIHTCLASCTQLQLLYHYRPIATTSKPTDLEPLDALNPIHHEQQRQQPPRHSGSDHDPHKLAYRPVFDPVER